MFVVDTLFGKSEHLVFRANSWYTPAHHPNGIETGQPDLACVEESIAAMLALDTRKRIPWHLMVSASEEKLEKDARVRAEQCGAYLACGNQSRPDFVGMYGLAVSPRSFHLQYSCPAGLTTLEEFDWGDDIIVLVMYVYTLYYPLPGKPSRDPSITLASTDDVFGPPTWNIDVGNTVYTRIVVSSLSDSLGRG